MSNVRNYIVNGVEVWQGKSSASGFRTRLFFTREDAEAEERWLDDRWRILKALLVIDAPIGEQEAAHRLRHTFKTLLLNSGWGSYPIGKPGQFERLNGLRELEVWETSALPSQDGRFLAGRYVSWLDGSGHQILEVIEPTTEALADFLNRKNDAIEPPH